MTYHFCHSCGAPIHADTRHYAPKPPLLPNDDTAVARLTLAVHRVTQRTNSPIGIQDVPAIIAALRKGGQPQGDQLRVAILAFLEHMGPHPMHEDCPEYRTLFTLLGLPQPSKMDPPAAPRGTSKETP